MALANAGNNPAAPGGFLQGLLQDVGGAVFALGGATCITSLRTLRAAAADPPLYTKVLVGTFLCGVLATWGGIWVTFGGPGRRKAGLIMFCATLVCYFVAAGLGDFDAKLLKDMAALLAA